MPPFNDVFVVPNKTCRGWYISVCNCGRAHGSCIEKDRSTTVFKSIQVLAGAAAPHPTHRSLILYGESAESLTINLYASLGKCPPLYLLCTALSARLLTVAREVLMIVFWRFPDASTHCVKISFEMKWKANCSIQFLMPDSKSMSEKFAN